MADEEKLEGGEELQDQNDQAPDAEEAETPQESGGEVAVDQDEPADAEGSEETPEAEAQDSSSADDNPDIDAQDASDSEEGSVDDLVEQQMLAELEKLESENKGEASAENTILSSDKGEFNEQDVHIPEYPAFGKTTSATEQKNLDLLLDVNLPISIELGRTTMRIKDILSLGPGSVVELKKLAGEPVDLLVNNKIVAKGEVVVVDENFGLRITSLLSPEERLRSLNE